MERLHRTLRLARLRGDLAAIAILEGRIAAEWLKVAWPRDPAPWARDPEDAYLRMELDRG